MPNKFKGKNFICEYVWGKRLGVKDGKPFVVKEKRPVGVVVAVGKDQVGYSLINSKDDYKYVIKRASKKNLLEVAYGRATKKPLKNGDDVPMSIANSISKMLERSRHYFKDDYEEKNI